MGVESLNFRAQVPNYSRVPPVCNIFAYELPSKKVMHAEYEVFLRLLYLICVIHRKSHLGYYIFI